MRSLAARLGPSGMVSPGPGPRPPSQDRPDFDASHPPFVSGRTGDTPANAATRLGQHLSPVAVGGPFSAHRPS